MSGPVTRPRFSLFWAGLILTMCVSAVVMPLHKRLTLSNLATGLQLDNNIRVFKGKISGIDRFKIPDGHIMERHLRTQVVYILFRDISHPILLEITLTTLAKQCL